MNREAIAKRKTRETNIELHFNIDGGGQTEVSTGIPFFDHMLEAFGRHGYFDLNLKAVGDLTVDAHHTMEDVGLVLGQALKQAVGDKNGICRYGWCLLPMDDALARVALDLSGRPCLVYDVQTDYPEVGGVNPRLFREFFQALVNSAGINLHIQRLAGAEAHHVFEAVFKGFGKSLDQATKREPRCQGVPSTKDKLD